MAGQSLIDEDAWRTLRNIKEQPGYQGVFTTDQAEGAIPNGTRIVKTWKETGDMTPLGAQGTVLGSVYERRLGYGYFVEWDHFPKRAVFVSEKKIDRLSEN